MLKTFGIRHHGPGSAKSLLKALQDYQPDKILIEGPPDANAMIKYVAEKELVPPVALLVYDPKDLGRASYFPFANFSPEWQAIKFALKAEIDVEFMDLPQSMVHGFQAKEAEKMDFVKEAPQDEFQQQLLRDPIGHISKLAGYEDSERWWSITFEELEEGEDVFDTILEMMTALRESRDYEMPVMEKLREAFMRKLIRKADKDGFERIAVVCGAWHSPALANYKRIKASADNAILKGIKKVKTSSTWVPWTFERLSFQSGYGAGVISPEWYQLVFNKQKNKVERWFTKAAHLLRKEDVDTSSAHIIEAVRLAETLATMRNLQLPGIQELKEAATTIFCQGDGLMMELVEERLVVGTKLGKVPKSIPVVPLQKDIETAIRKARMSKYYQNEEAGERELDLRKETQLLASQLLHRLNVLGIKWGKEKDIKGRNIISGFKERWKLKWNVNFPFEIIKANMWGNTLEAAATAFLKKESETIEELGKLAEYIDRSIKANLPQAIHPLSERLKTVSALTKDVSYLMKALPSLVDVMRYGSTRNADYSSIQTVIDSSMPRICVGLPNACSNLGDDAATALYELTLNANQAIHVYNNNDFILKWYESLDLVANSPIAHPQLKGVCARLLLDRQQIDREEMELTMRQALSMANEVKVTAAWLEGFLMESGIVLIHEKNLWKMVDSWIEQVPMHKFEELLPILRRTFSKFQNPERKKMMEMAKKITEGHSIDTIEEERPIDEQRASMVLPTILEIIGR